MLTIYSDNFDFTKISKKEVIEYKKELTLEIKKGCKIGNQYYLNKLKIVNNYIFNNYFKK